jgi:hypothetical protein
MIVPNIDRFLGRNSRSGPLTVSPSRRTVICRFWFAGHSDSGKGRSGDAQFCRRGIGPLHCRAYSRLGNTQSQALGIAGRFTPASGRAGRVASYFRSWSGSLGVTPRERAKTTIFCRLTLRSPRSTLPTYVRGSPVVAARPSWEISNPIRNWRIYLPRNCCGDSRIHHNLRYDANKSTDFK